MNERYIKRSLEPVLIRATTEFPAVVLTGPLCGVHSNDVSCSFMVTAHPILVAA